MYLLIVDPARLSHLDTVIPLAYELKKTIPNVYLQVVFSKRKPYDDFINNKVLFDLCNIIGSVTYVKVKRVSKKIKAIEKFFKLYLTLPFYIRLIYSRNSIYFKYKYLDTFFHKVIFNLNKFKKGKTFTYSGNIGSYRDEFKRFYDKYGKIRDTSNIQTVAHYAPGDGMLVCSVDAIKYLGLRGYSNFLIIGYPVLYDAFIDYVDSNHKTYVESEIKSNYRYDKDCIVSVYLNKFWGRWFNRDDKWFEDAFVDVISSIKEKNKHPFIFLRLHPTLDRKIVDTFIQKYKMDNVVISFLHPSVLAKSSKYVVAIGQSSTFIHVMGMGTPYVEYGTMPSLNYKLFPEGSLYSEFGTIVAKNKIELLDSIDSINNKKINFSKFNNLIKHKTDLEYFYRLN